MTSGMKKRTNLWFYSTSLAVVCSLQLDIYNREHSDRALIWRTPATETNVVDISEMPVYIDPDE